MSQSFIADQLESQIGRIVEDWTSAVRDDPRIQSDAKLSERGLIDHVPVIIEEICQLIRTAETPGVRNALAARTNVYIRVLQGYTGRDLVRELSLLRITLLDYLMEISRERFETTAEEFRNAAKILNLYLDEEMRYAISAFCSGSIEPSTGTNQN